MLRAQLFSNHLQKQKLKYKIIITVLFKENYRETQKQGTEIHRAIADFLQDLPHHHRREFSGNHNQTRHPLTGEPVLHLLSLIRRCTDVTIGRALC